MNYLHVDEKLIVNIFIFRRKCGHFIEYFLYFNLKRVLTHQWMEIKNGVNKGVKRVLLLFESYYSDTHLMTNICTISFFFPLQTQSLNKRISANKGKKYDPW